MRYAHRSPDVKKDAVRALDVRTNGTLTAHSQEAAQKLKSPRVTWTRRLFRSAQGGIRTRHGRMENPKQDAPLPTILLILLGFAIPSRPTLSHLIPPDSAPEGHIRGTWRRPLYRTQPASGSSTRSQKSVPFHAEPAPAGGSE